MCVSALIVLGDKIRHKIDEQIQEQWLMSYIGECGDLLCKLMDSNEVLLVRFFDELYPSTRIPGGFEQ